MTKMTYKQIAKAVESGKSVKARVVANTIGAKSKLFAYVTVDGETFEVSAVSWNKVSAYGSPFDVKLTGSKDLSVHKHEFTYEIR